MTKVNVELNFFYTHWNDAKTFAKWAKLPPDQEVHPSLYVRHSIISVVFASEALINRVLSEFTLDSNVSKIVDKVSLMDKWYLAPFLCSRADKIVPFEKGKEPYQSFKELIQIRNWLAHPKVETFLEAEADPQSSVNLGPSDEEYPWLEILKGERWPQTGIPKNPFEIDYTHADISLHILDSMIQELSVRLDGQIDEEWLNLITVRDDRGLHQYKAPLRAIWPGYSGARR